MNPSDFFFRCGEIFNRLINLVPEFTDWLMQPCYFNEVLQTRDIHLLFDDIKPSVITSSLDYVSNLEFFLYSGVFIIGLRIFDWLISLIPGDLI